MLYHLVHFLLVIGLPITVFVVVSITETVLSLKVSHIHPLIFWVICYIIGPSPTVIGLPITVFVVVSITETVSYQC